MWNPEAIDKHALYLAAQENAVLEALGYDLLSLDDVTLFVTAKLNDDVDKEFIAEVWASYMEASHVSL